MKEGNNPYGNFDDADFKRLSDFIYKYYGINLYPNKKVLVKSRLIKRLKALGMQSYHDYCKHVLENDPDQVEAVEMINRISTNKTEFFREKNHFEFLAKHIIPDLVKVINNKHIQLWSAGCSSGEEPYSISMLLTELKSNYHSFDFNIYASDISTHVLKKASEAIYSNGLLPQINFEYRKKYLLKSKNKQKEVFRINKQIRDRVSFFRYNLLNNSKPFKNNMDIIFCRNTLIYFDRPTQKRVVENMIDILNPGGYLILGHSESLINMGFNLSNITASVYKKN